LNAETLADEVIHKLRTSRQEVTQS
jgi:hypothetical protein